jgi:hypothetical protein
MQQQQQQPNHQRHTLELQCVHEQDKLCDLSSFVSSDKMHAVTFLGHVA